jgi:hypothetical protein
MTMKGDSLFIGGVTRDTGSYLLICLFFALLDTGGHLLGKHYHVLDTVVSTNYGYNILLDDSFILLTARGVSDGHAASNIGILEKLFANGDLYAKKVLLDSFNNTQAFCYTAPMHSATGYFTIGLEQLLDYNSNLYYYRFDDSLHLLQRRYSTNTGDDCEYISCVLQTDTDTYVIGGGQGFCVGHIEIGHSMIMVIKENGDTVSS